MIDIIPSTNPAAEPLVGIALIVFYVVIVGLIVLLIAIILAVLNTAAEAKRIRILLEKRLPAPRTDDSKTEIEQN